MRPIMPGDLVTVSFNVTRGLYKQLDLDAFRGGDNRCGELGPKEVALVVASDKIKALVIGNRAQLGWIYISFIDGFDT